MDGEECEQNLENQEVIGGLLKPQDFSETTNNNMNNSNDNYPVRNYEFNGR